MNEFVVVDASVTFKWLVEEENSDKATALTRLWDNQGAQWRRLALCLSKRAMLYTDGLCEGNLQWRLRQASCRT